LRGAVKAFNFIQRHRRQNSTRPGPKILGGDVLAGDFLEIGVDIARRDILAVARFVDILKQFLPGQLLASFYNLGDAAIPDAQ